MSRGKTTKTIASAGAALAVVAAVLLAARAAPLTLQLAGRDWRILNPGWLLLLLAVPYLIAVAPGRGGDRRPGQGLLTGMRIAWTVLLVLGLCGPVLHRRSADVAVVALLDVSGSVGDREVARAEKTLSLLREQGKRRGVRVSVARFARVPADPAGREREGHGHQLRFSGRDGEDSNPGLALGFGMGRLSPDSVGRLLLLSDGRETAGDLLEAGERARRRNARVFFHPLEGHTPTPADVAIAGLDGPATVQPGAGFEIQARISAGRAGSARLRLLRDGEPAGTDSDRVVALGAGVNVVRFASRLTSDAGARFRLEVTEAEHDAEPRNNSALLAVTPQARPRLLVAESTADSTTAFRRALAAEQIESQPIRGARLPGFDRLAELDLVVLSDLGASVGDGAAAALERFVRERGGGLLVAGGMEDAARSRFESLLPVVYDTSEQKQEATLALGLVIDRSGSMSGPKMDLTKEAARGAAELMNPQDLITVVTFDSQAQTVVRLQPASNRQRILSDIAQIRASGGTNVLPGLQEAFDQLLSARARKKHAIVLSDGQSPAEGVRELVDEAAAGGITVSAVGVGDGADLALLQTIAGRGGGRFYHTRDPTSIPRIFTREAAQFTRSNLVEAPSRVVATRPAQALAGVPIASAPALHGYARARPKKGAEVLLSSGSGDPLLVRWQLGLGQVLAWTSDLTPRWSGEWLRWRHFGKLWGQLVRSAVRRQGGESLPMTVGLRGDRAVVQVRAFDSEDRPLVGLVGRLVVTDVPARDPIPGPTRSLSLAAVGAGIYQAEVPLHDAPALLFAAELGGDSGQGPQRLHALGRLSVPPLREQLPPGAEQAADGLAGRALLAAVAARTGGAEVGADLTPLLEAGDDRVTVWWPLRRGLLLAALALFLGEIAGRRANFRRLVSRVGGGRPVRSG
jgi:Ca-activated chloride channel homolog